MKKLLTFLTLLTLSIGVSWAATMTYTPTSAAGAGTVTGGPSDLTLTNTHSGGNSMQSGQGLQITTAKSPFTATISGMTSSYKVTKIVVTYCTNSQKGQGTISAKIGNNQVGSTFTVKKPSSGGTTLKTATLYDDADGTSFVDNENFTINITVGVNSIYLNKVEIVYGDNSGPAAVTPPTITLDPASGTYYEGDEVTVTLTPTTEGSTISYNIGDGWTNYTAPFTISETTTIQAKATLNGVESSVKTQDVPFKKSVANIAAFKALSDADAADFKFTGDVVVTYFNSTNNQYVWVKDDTGYSLLHNSNLSIAEPAPKTGDVIKGGWKGKKSVYNKLIEVTNVTTAAIDGTETVTPAELTLADVTLDKQATYGWLRGVTISEVNNRNFTIGDGQTTVRGYNTYNSVITLPTDYEGKTYDIRGIVNVYNNPQFTPVEIVEHVSDEPAYYLYGTFKMNGTAWVQGDAAYKFTDNGDGTYSLNNVMLPDNVRFKIVKMQGETVLADYGAANNGADYGIHAGWHTNIPMDGADAYTIAAGASTNFTIHDNNGTLTFDAARIAQMFMKGNYDNENFDVKTALTATETGWTIKKELAKDNEFGFVDEWGTWFGTTKTVNAENLGNEIDLGNSGNFKIGLDETAEYTISVNSAKNKVVITRAFAVNCSTVTDIEGKTGGTISADKETAYPGETVTLTINTNNGYTLNGVTLNGTAIEPVEGVYSFTMPQAVANVVASFTANTYTITLDNDSEMGTVTGLPETAHTGQDVSFSVTPEEGYTVKSVSVTPGSVSVTENEGTYTFGMPPFDVTVTVTYNAPLQPCEIPFTETWNGTKGQGGNDGSWSGISTTTAAIADHEGWIYTRQDGAEFQGFGASACLRVGDRNEEGAATTPDIIVTNGTIYKMTFKAGSWDNNVAINFSATGATLFADEACTTPLSSLDIAYREWGEYTVYVKATSNLMNITFATPAYKRFFLDDVNIDYFATPEIIETTLAVLCENGVPGKTYTISDEEGLLGVYSQGTSVWFKDEARAVDYQEPQASDKDYAIVINEKDLKINKNQKDFAQNNWIEVVFPAEANYNNKYVKNLTGTYSNVNGNPVLTLTQAVAEEDVTPVPASALAYEPNPYIAANFVGNQQYQGDTYFFSMPKAQEYAQILWAVWDGSKMNMPTDNNVYGFTGSFPIKPNLNISNFDGLQNGKAYNFHAIIRKGAATTTGAPILKGTGDTYVVYPTDLNPQIPTAINGVSVNGEVKSVKYVNVAGMVSDKPFSGVNIVVTEYTDGSRTTSKMLRK